MAKGLKLCPTCKQTVGCRTKICACSHEFVFKEKKPVKIPEKMKYRPGGRQVLYTSTPPRKSHLQDPIIPCKPKNMAEQGLSEFNRELQKVIIKTSGLQIKYSKTGALELIKHIYSGEKLKILTEYLTLNFPATPWDKMEDIKLKPVRPKNPLRLSL